MADELLRHHTVRIERRPLDRRLADGEVPAARYEGDTTIVPVVKEVVVTQKRLVLVGAIRIVRVGGTRVIRSRSPCERSTSNSNGLEPKHR